MKTVDPTISRGNISSKENPANVPFQEKTRKFSKEPEM